MDVGDVATMAVGGILLTAFATAILKERRRRRRLVSILDQEARGLCREAADLGEAMCERWAQGELIDEAFLDRYALSEPQTYPGLVPSLWRLPEALASRHIELHGHLSLARTRFAAWRGGERSEISTYLLLSALLGAANGGDGLLRDSALHLGRTWRPQIHMPLASALVQDMEQKDLDLVDFGYWSFP